MKVQRRLSSATLMFAVGLLYIRNEVDIFEVGMMRCGVLVLLEFALQEDRWRGGERDTVRLVVGRT
jgi:hypothetical protein